MRTHRFPAAWSIVLLVAICSSAQSAFAAAPPATKPATAPAGKFPGPLVDVILKGWHGVPWGATVAEFQKIVPSAKQNENGRWTTGEAEDLAGVPVTVEYVFSKAGQLASVVFQPGDADKKTLGKKLQAAGALRPGEKPNWAQGPVQFVLGRIDDDQLAVAMNLKFADRPATKPAK